MQKIRKQFNPSIVPAATPPDIGLEVDVLFLYLIVNDVINKDKNGEIHTPIPDSFLDGITRRTVIEIAKSKNIKINERKI